MPATIEKICVVCRQNVASKPRTKDNAGNYYCNPCWAAKGASRSVPPPPVTVATNEQVACPACGGVSELSTDGRRGQCTECKKVFVIGPSSESPDFEIDDDVLPDDDLAVDDPLAFLAAAQPPQQTVGNQASDDWFECPICHSQVTAAKMDGSGVCVDCARPRAAGRPMAAAPAKSQSKGSSFTRPLVLIAVVVVICVVAAGGYIGFQRYQYSQYADAVRPLLSKLEDVQRKTSIGLKRYEMEAAVTGLKRVQAECASGLTAGQKKYSSWTSMDIAVDHYSQSVDWWKNQISDAGYGNAAGAKAMDSLIQSEWAGANLSILLARKEINDRK